MASFATRLMRRQLKLLKPILKNANINGMRLAQDRLGDLGAKAASAKVDFVPERFSDFDAAWAHPKDRGRTDRVVLYLHGGSYVAGCLEYAKGFGGLLAMTADLSVFCPAYRLAPENPFPAALDDALTAYRYLLGEGYESSDIFLGGESAGGGLIYALTLRLRELGLPLPRALVAISPWADLTFSGESYLINRDTDPTLFEESLRCHAGMYAPDQAQNPLVSPLFGALDGFPPSLIFVGADEILYCDAVALYEKLIEAGSPAELNVEAGMWHAYVLYGVPESQAALFRICAFLKEDVKR